MKLLPTRKPKPDDALKVDSIDVDAPTKTVSYTNGGALASRGMTYLVWGIVVLIAAVAVLGFLKKPAAVAAEKPTETVAVESSALTQAAGSYAVSYVGTWLSSTRTSSSALQGYIDTAPASLGDRPIEYRSLAVSSVTEDPDTSSVLVVVSAELLEQPDPEQDPAYVLRFFSVPVATLDERLSVSGFPALISGPAKTSKIAPSELRYRLPATSPAAQTFALFLTAYLTGQGSTTPYLSPGTDIAPVTPPPYKTITVSSQNSSLEPAPTPADGDTLAVETVVALHSAEGMSVTSTYRAVLTARAGRWEISMLTTAPTLPEVTPSATLSPETPSPQPSTPQPAKPTPQPTSSTDG